MRVIQLWFHWSASRLLTSQKEVVVYLRRRAGSSWDWTPVSSWSGSGRCHGDSRCSSHPEQRCRRRNERRMECRGQVLVLQGPATNRAEEKTHMDTRAQTIVLNCTVHCNYFHFRSETLQIAIFTWIFFVYEHCWYLHWASCLRSSGARQGPDDSQLLLPQPESHTWQSQGYETPRIICDAVISIQKIHLWEFV